MAIIVELQTQDGKSLSPSYISEFIPDLKILKIAHNDSLANITFSKIGDSTIKITADFAASLKEGSLELKLSPDTEKFTPQFSLLDEESVLVIQKTEKVDPEKI